MARFEITCTGNATVKHPAELAKVEIAVTASENDNETAVRLVTETANAIVHKIKPSDTYAQSVKAHHLQRLTSSITFDPPPAHWGASPNPDAKKLYCASVTISIQFIAFEDMGKMLTDMAKMEHVQVKRVDWSLRPETIHHTHGQLRKEAAHDAIQKARQYFQACTVYRFKIIRINDGNRTTNLFTQPKVASAFMGSNRQAVSRSSPEPSISFEPSEIEISIDLNACFEAEAPELE